MTDYTPTTDRVRDHYAAWVDERDPDATVVTAAAEFDRWLAAHDAAVAAKALRDAADEVGRLDFGPAPLFSRAAAHKHGSDVAAERLRSRADRLGGA